MTSDTFNFGSLLQLTSKITFTPEYEGNKLQPLEQKFCLDSTEREAQRIAMGVTYDQFVESSSEQFYDAVVANRESLDNDDISIDKMKALITNDTSVYDNDELYKMRSLVINVPGLYQKFYEKKLSFKRRLVYSKAYSMIVNRTTHNEITFKDFFNSSTNVIPYPLIFIIAMFYDSEEAMIQCPKFTVDMLESIDITDA